VGQGGRGEKVFHRAESTGTLVSLIQREFIEARLIEAFCCVRPHLIGGLLRRENADIHVMDDMSN
jgi:hypothetical protein